MKFFILELASFLAVTLTAGGGQASASYAQVNFYYDKACKSYAGHAYPTPIHGAVGSQPIPKANVVGGPYGSQSMLFVYANCDCNNCIGTYPAFCKNSECNAFDAMESFGECKTFANGVWAAVYEECPIN